MEHSAYKKWALCWILGLFIALLIFSTFGLKCIFGNSGTTEAKIVKINGTTGTPHIEESYLLVVGGDNGYGLVDKVELLSLNNKTLPTCLQTRNALPLKLWVAVGATMNGIPIICGGETWRNGRHVEEKRCWTYDAMLDQWNFFAELGEGRRYSAGAYNRNNGLIITGGYPAKSSTEQFTDKGLSEMSFTPMPIGLRAHCLVSLDNADDGGFLLTGGRDGTGDSRNKKTFIYRSASNKWIQMADMPTARSRPACGPVRSTIGGPVEKVVVAGGWTGSSWSIGLTSVVEIYDLEKNTWERLADLPRGDLFMASVIPHEETFLMVGGHTGAYVSEEVFKFKKANGSWITFPSRLSVPRHSAMAMLVSSDIFPNC